MAPLRTGVMHAVKELSADRLDIRTYCGRDGFRFDGHSVIYTARDGGQFRAQIADEGVECRTCLHALRADKRGEIK